ncbi:hypothetical protein VM98_04740 [Streptomyces rubellomurinus subsp. indigoferus]|nr:hypothetical protein VM98_04740 [Streptomyces rubellomurinus subsp. indigoferus]
MVQVVSSTGGRSGGHDDAALDEIELAGELMIAATASPGERLPTERIDEVLLDRVVPRPPDRPSDRAAEEQRPGH